MGKKKAIPRVLRWTLWSLTVLLVLFMLQVTLLAFPQLIVSESVRVGAVELHYDGSQSAEVDRLAANVSKRLRESGFCDSLHTHRVYFIRNQGLYALFARLAMVTPLAQGFALSVFGNSFASASRIRALGERTAGRPKYGVWEGDPSHTIAHEIGHLYLTGRIGRGNWSRLPQWKQEGLPEYIANIGIIRQDTLATLSNRLRILNEDWLWGGGDRWDRTHYEAGLLVEFLLDVRGCTIDEILSSRVTRDGTLASLTVWCDSVAVEL